MKYISYREQRVFQSTVIYHRGGTSALGDWEQPKRNQFVQPVRRTHFVITTTDTGMYAYNKENDKGFKYVGLDT